MEPSFQQVESGEPDESNSELETDTSDQKEKESQAGTETQGETVKLSQKSEKADEKTDKEKDEKKSEKKKEKKSEKKRSEKKRSEKKERKASRKLREQEEVVIREVREEITPELPPFPTNFLDPRPKRIEAMEAYYETVDRDRKKWKFRTGCAKGNIINNYNDQISQLQIQSVELDTQVMALQTQMKALESQREGLETQRKTLENQRFAELREIDRAQKMREKHFRGAMGTAKTQISALMQGEGTETRRGNLRRANTSPAISLDGHERPLAVAEAESAPAIVPEPETEDVPVVHAILLDHIIPLDPVAVSPSTVPCDHDTESVKRCNGEKESEKERDSLELAPGRDPPPATRRSNSEYRANEDKPPEGKRRWFIRNKKCTN